MEKKFELLTVTFSQLSYNPKINARGTTLTDVASLAETIKNEGLVQPLALRPAGKKYEPIEGGRRYHAIALLIEKKAAGWTAKTPIPAIARKMTDAEALEASLATHVTRLGLEPADEAIAFRNLAKSGRKAEDIATTFAVSKRFVEQRLAIGALPAAIIKALKAGEIDARTAEAFTLSGDGKQQLQLFTTLAKRRELNPQSVRRQLVGKATRANDAHARYVGDKAYLAAGGTIAADLFGEERWYEDGKLLGKLLDEKVKATAAALEKEGWSFVKVARDHWHDYNTGGYGNSWTKLTPIGQQLPEAKKRIAEIDAEIGRLRKRLAEIEKIDPDGNDRVLDDEHFKIDDEIIPDLTSERESIPKSSFTADQKKQSGVVIRIDQSRIEIMYGMVDPASARAAEKEKKKAAAKKVKAKGKTKAVAASVSGPGAPAADVEEADFAGALKAELATYMSEALKQAIADRPQAAHYALIATLVMDALEDHVEGGSPIAIALTRDPRDWRNSPDDDKQASAFGGLLAAALKPLAPTPPEDKAERRRWSKNDGDVLHLADVVTKLELLDHTELMRLEALLVARALKIDMSFMTDPDVATMIRRFDPEVGKVWTPDEAFFQKLKKPDLVAALEEAAVVDIPRSGGKAQLVALSLAKLPALGWLPKPLRAPSYAGPGSNAWADAQGARVADAVAGQAMAPAGEPLQQAAE